MLGVFAEFEREIIRERIIAGQQRARSRGRRIGRRSVIDETLRSRAARLRSDGLSLRDIGGRLNVSAAYSDSLALVCVPFARDQLSGTGRPRLC
jgi:DNA invertase Pin-like site-specific DNA recombinase